MFDLLPSENRKLQDWLKKHNTRCRFSKIENQGAIGGRLTYKFTPTGIGVITIVSCACNVEIDVTDYSQF